ncbi:hypothetical protein HDU76_000107 [Blyttiomyces sp. JEL0837]|nr:hypothetical protein HDU76_000107 [Blyttiomyces sp. JEL0837]
MPEEQLGAMCKYTWTYTAINDTKCPSVSQNPRGLLKAPLEDYPSRVKSLGACTRLDTLRVNLMAGWSAMWESKVGTLIILRDILPSYLAPQELLKVVSTCRELRGSLTYSAVIQSILFTADNNKTRKACVSSLKSMIDLLRQGKIWKPSPLRLLRVCIGRRCECGIACKGVGNVPQVRPEFGIAYCWDCTKATSTKVRTKKKYERENFGEFLYSKRTCIYYACTVAYLRTKDYVKDGEKCGPVISVQTFQRMKKEGITIDAYLNSLEVAEQCSPESESIKGLVKLYDSFKPDSIVIVLPDPKEKRKNMDLKEKEATKKRKVDSLIEDIAKLADAHKFPTGSLWKTTSLFDNMFSDIKNAPSSANRWKISKIVETIKYAFISLPPTITDYPRPTPMDEAIYKLFMEKGGETAFFRNASPVMYTGLKHGLYREVIGSYIFQELFDSTIIGHGSPFRGRGSSKLRGFCTVFFMVSNAPRHQQGLALAVLIEHLGISGSRLIERYPANDYEIKSMDGSYFTKPKNGVRDYDYHFGKRISELKGDYDDVWGDMQRACEDFAKMVLVAEEFLKLDWAPEKAGNPAYQDVKFRNCLELVFDGDGDGLELLRKRDFEGLFEMCKKDWDRFVGILSDGMKAIETVYLKPSMTNNNTLIILRDLLLPYLAPQDLLQVISICRELQGALTYSIVIQSILFASSTTNNIRKGSLVSLKTIIDLLRQGKIWKPSPIRLLRICMGRTCELGVKCEGLAKVMHVRPEYGLFMCRVCEHATSTKVSTNRYYRGSLQHSRTSSSECYMRTTDCVKDGEKCGPVVTVETLARIKKQGIGLQEYLNSPEVAALSSPNSDSIKAIIKLYDTYQPCADELDEQQRKRKISEQQDRQDVKKQKFETLVDHVAKLAVADNFATGSLWKTSALFNNLMKAYENAPSSANKKGINRVAEELRVAFGDLSADFMETFQQSTTFDRAIVNLAKQKGNSAFFKKASTRVFAGLRAGLYREVVASFVFKELHPSQFTFHYITEHNGVRLNRASHWIKGMEMAFVSVCQAPKQYQGLAVKTWRDHTDNVKFDPFPDDLVDPKKPVTLPRIRDHADYYVMNASRIKAEYDAIWELVQEVSEEYRRLVKVAEEYLTLEWSPVNLENPEYQSEGFQRVLREVLKGDQLEPLRKRDFEALFDLAVTKYGNG